MTIFENIYLRSNVRMMSFLGQWPYQSLFLRVIIRILIMLAIWSIFIPKLIKLCKVINDINGIIECIPMIGLHTVSVTKYFNWMINSHKMKVLLRHMQQDWDNLKSDEDKKIMNKICERGKFISIGYSSENN
uniref:Olfactory receptor 131 n=1 Tax=Aulacocentrum confusum TaxID=2767324 RepID=A0A7G8Z9F0_9HYME|nr:olfactory receptor 131 [Aulacocentrum confusum]